MSETSNQPQRDFAATVEQLETLVERLESGELTLEDSLAAFEQGVRLTRDAQQRLDDAELKVRALTEGADGSLQVSPFAAPAVPDTSSNESAEGPQEETPPW
ncbi:exodeoxyribonuclease VII small subunit [Halomonas sp. Bachu 37]|uniref:exodeoxyribonuclease VII small subunit n=1 Tax=Halomonas kashgarensis TaxID=3084920 RepID=UPI0032179B31